ncbi:hypothetical protein [Thermococcus sp. 21S7]|uniref:hypothetical protein n=1 Tax=Thermococcus sp. 21S7 TaxID=1638221 RepID=UPI0014391FBF|nr:hypothetical protein [Thermococcus sp. 21S7]NJE60469.1 hypothetical protein [Thermococcus sp. 21S7]
MKLDVFMEYEAQALKTDMARPHDAFRLYVTFSLLELNSLLAQFRSRFLSGNFSMNMFNELYTATDEAFTLFEPKISPDELDEREKKAFEAFRRMKTLELDPKKLPLDVRANILITVAEALVKFAVKHGLLDIMQLSIPQTLTAEEG